MLLDPAHEDYDAYMPPELTAMRSANKLFDVLNVVVDLALMTTITKKLLQRVPAIRPYRRFYRQLFEQEMADWPGDVREALVERHTPASIGWRSDLERRGSWDDLYDEVRAAGPTPDVPLIIVSSAGSDGFRQAVSSGESERLIQDETAAKLRLYTDIAAFVTNGEVRQVDSGHVTLPFRQVEAIAQEIEDTVTGADLANLRRLADDGDEEAANKLAGLAARRQDVAELKHLIDAGNELAADRLAELAARRGDVDTLNRLVDEGSEVAATLLSGIIRETE